MVSGLSQPNTGTGATGSTLGYAPPPVGAKTAKYVNYQDYLNQQAAAQQAQFDRVDQTQPGSTSTWQVNGTYPDGTPKWENTVAYTGSQATQYDQQNQIAETLNGTAMRGINNVNDSLSHPLNFDSATPLQTGVNSGPIQTQIADSGPIQNNLDYSNLSALPGVGDFSADRDAVSNSLYDQATSRLNPQFNQSEEQLRSRLANQGISENSDAYRTAMDNFGRTKTDAYNTANNSAIAAGGDEQSRIFGLALGARQQGQSEADNQGNFANLAQNQDFTQNEARLTDANAATGQQYTQDAGNAELNNSARQQQVQEASYLNNNPINQMATLLGNTQGVAQPTFNEVPQVGVAAPDALSYKLGKLGIAAQKQGGVMGAIGSLAGAAGSAAIMSSDARVKMDIHGVGRLANGIPTYTFRYIGDDTIHYGVMAQDVLEVMPDAVITNDNGYMMVDYGKVYASC